MREYMIALAGYRPVVMRDDRAARLSRSHSSCDGANTHMIWHLSISTHTNMQRASLPHGSPSRGPSSWPLKVLCVFSLTETNVFSLVCRLVHGRCYGSGEYHSTPTRTRAFWWCEMSYTTEQLRKLTTNCLEENMSDTAAYYADKLVTFSNFDREAVLLLAKVPPPPTPSREPLCGSFLW